MRVGLLTAALIAAACGGTSAATPEPKAAPADPDDPCERVAAHVVSVWRVEDARRTEVAADCRKKQYSDEQQACLLAARSSSQVSACLHRPYDEVSVGQILAAPESYAGKRVVVAGWVIRVADGVAFVGTSATSEATLRAELPENARVETGHRYELRGELRDGALAVESIAPRE